MQKDVEQQKAHFENIAHTYRKARECSKHLLLKKLIWMNFFANVDFCVKSKVLEPMCGYAEGFDILSEYAKVDMKYTGFDYSEILVNHVKSTRSNLDVYIGDITTFNFKKNEYDIVIIIGGLHHVYKHVNSIISDIYCTLKSGGVFINFEPTHNTSITKKIREYIYRSSDFFDDETEKGFELDYYNKIHYEQGFSLKKQIYPGLLAYILFYNPDAFPMLNIGRGWLTKFLFIIENRLYSTWIARKLSFATLSIWEK